MARAQKNSFAVPGRGERQAGFSIIELLIAFAILGVLAAIGLPGFGDFVNSNRMSATTNNLVGALYAARSASITRGASTVVCPSSNSSSVNADCSSSGSWSDGYISFVDDNGDGNRNTGTPSEELLVQVNPIEAGFVLTSDAVYQDSVIFSDNGTSVNSAGIPLSGSFQIEYGELDGRSITVSANGRVSSKVVP